MMAPGQKNSNVILILGVVILLLCALGVYFFARRAPITPREAPGATGSAIILSRPLR